MKLRRVVFIALGILLCLQATSCATYERAKQKKSTVLPMLEEYYLEQMRAEDHTYDDFALTMPEPASFTIQSQILYQSSEIVIRAVQAENHWAWGDGIRIEVANSTGKKISVFLDSLSVNDRVTDASCYLFIDPYETVSDVVYLDPDDSENETIGFIEISFRINDDQYFSDEYTTPVSQIFTSLYNDSDFTADPVTEGTIIYYEKGIKIEARYSEESGSPKVIITMTNATDKDLTFHCTRVMANGIDLPMPFSKDVSRSDYDTKSISLSSLQAGVSEPVSTVTLGFSVEEDDGYYTLVSYAEASISI